MKTSHSSIFPAVPDNRQNETDSGFLALLICGVVAVGCLSALIELLAYLGVYIPHVLSLGLGLFLGLPIGAHAARILRRDHRHQ